jgi:hypothetical protein
MSNFSKKPTDGSGYFQNSIRLRQRFNNTLKSDTESGKDILGPSNPTGGIHSSTITIGRDGGYAWEDGRSRHAQGKIAIVKQWSVNEND